MQHLFMLAPLCITLMVQPILAQASQLGAATGMLVDLTEAQSPPLMLVVGSTTPSFSFVAPGESPGKRQMTDYQIVVRNSAGSTAWDSGKVAAPGGHVAGVACGKALQSGASYTWTVRYWASDLLAPEATSTFEVGLLSESDWAGAEWLGGGQNQFKLSPPDSTLSTLRTASGAKAKLHVAAPGGATVEVGGDPIGDAVGVSLWTEVDKSVQYISYDLTSALLGAGVVPKDIIVTVGGGFFTSTDHAAKAVNGAATTACRILLLLDTGSGDQGLQVAMRSSTAVGAFQGRVGPVVTDDPWAGSTLNLTLGATEGWGVATAVDQEEVPQGVLFPLAAPYATTRGNFKALSVKELPNRPGSYLYTFPSNIVGHASVAASAASGTGRLTLQHCEVWNHSAGGCIPYDIPPYKYPLPICGFNHDGTPDKGSLLAGCDTYILDSATPSQIFSPKFTWHGFQYVVVTPSAGVHFSAELSAVTAHWTTADLVETATINFSGAGAETLTSINQIVKASQISNVAAYMPTDCPTREKHGWLGDSQITAEEAMYNLWTPGIFSRFLSQIRDSQLTSGGNEGFVAGVVPGHTSPATPSFGQRSSGLDISWTAAYPLDAGWLLRYYGDVASVTEHWPSLMLYVDGQLRVATSPSYESNSTSPGLPDFYTWGDWCAAESRADATPGTGPQLGAANFLMALKSMVEIGTAVGDAVNAAKYNATYSKLLPIFDKRFWNDTMETWASDPLELQTLTAVTLGAGVGSPAKRAKAVAALDRDITRRGDHLTVGSAGQKWLLRTLSKEGKHDTALKLATQTSYPSWGYWLANGATTCWESWSGVADPSHPPHPTHNHIFLCGGIGEWMYEHMAGIVPTSAGYATVDVKPQISKTLGPSSVNAAVKTVPTPTNIPQASEQIGGMPPKRNCSIVYVHVRGTVISNWTRHTTKTVAAAGTKLLSLQVQIPSGIHAATVHVPLLGRKAGEVHLELRNSTLTHETVALWQDGLPRSVAGLGLCKPVVAADGDEVLELVAGAGVFEFGVSMFL